MLIPTLASKRPALASIFERRLQAPIAMAMLIIFGLSSAAAKPAIKLVALGDSLTAGYLLPADQAFPAVLQTALRKDGLKVNVVNAGVSGDTASGGLARLDWALGEGTDAVILELGANDMLRGIDPAITAKALDAIVAKLRARHIKVLIAGMLAAPSLGKAYGKAFNRIYPNLAAKYHVPLYPFFLQGVVAHPHLMLSDGKHPNGKGVARIVKGILPQVETMLDSIHRGGRKPTRRGARRHAG